MNLKSLIVGALVMTGSVSFSGVSQTMDNPMTSAMMEVYSQELEANPQNYEIYFRRANEYYRYNQYLRALSDIDNTLKYAPANDTDLLFQVYSLRGDTYQMLGKFREALSDYSEALKLDPTSFMALYQKANCEYELGEYAQAKADYTRLRQMDNRSAEALTGLARVAVKENNLGNAAQYMDDAVAMMPADSDIYVRRSSVRRMLGNNTGAVDDLLMAISIDNNSRAFQELINISNEDYPAVITGLSNSISLAPEQGMFYYIRAVIAQAHFHYMSAITDYRKIIDENMYNYAGIFGSLGECYLALCDYERATESLNHAIGMTPDNGAYYITLAKVRRALGRNEQALSTADTAVEKLPGNTDALIEKAMCLYALGKYADASEIFGEIVMDDPDNAMYNMLRAWVINDGQKQKGNALGSYKRVIDIADNLPADASVYAKARSLRGFALLFTSHAAEANKWMEEILLQNRDTDGSINYLGACFYAQAGETEKAFECVERALSRGYADRYNWTVYDAARINVAPIRGERLNKLLANYSYLFE